MADIRSNFIAGRMNKSVDERLVPQGEYVDANNVRLGSTETTEIGAVENSKGNTQLTFLAYKGNPLSEPAIPTDPQTTFAIGSFEDGMEETIYWFIHDSNAGVASPTGKIDMIVSFNTNTNTVTYHVISLWDGVAGSNKTTLNFNPKNLVTGINKIEDLLYFTDDLNPPRYINVTRNYDDPSAGGLDGIEEEDINVIVKPPGFEDSVGGSNPLPVPLVTPENFPGDENYMETRFLCFAYRYRYTDGGYSATSLFSQPAFQPGGFRFNLDNFTNSGMVNRYNGATVKFSTGSSRVVQVDLLYKESTSNVIYVIERYNKKDLGWSDDSLQSLTFSNSKIFTTLGSDELLRQYDNVPRLAKAQTIQGNRLIYGNYIDGYDIVNENGQKIPLSFRTDHIIQEIGGVGLPTPVATTGEIYSIGQPSGGAINDSMITFDLSSLDLPIPAGLTLTFEVSVQSAPSGGSATNPQGTGPDIDLSFQNTSPFALTWQFICPTSYASVNNLLTSTEFQQAIGTDLTNNFQPLLPTNLSNQGGTLTDKFNNAIQAPPSTPLEIINTSIGPGASASCSTLGNPGTAVCNQQGFGYTVGGSTFSLQVPAAHYCYQDIDPGTGAIISTSSQFEFFNFVDFSSTVGYLLTADTYSLHSNRDYETGIVYMDDYGRASTVLVSNDNTIYIPPIDSVAKNTIEVTLSNLPPYWASKYKFVVKPSQGEYFTIYSSSYSADAKDPSVFWFRLDGNNTNLVSIGQTLIVKVDTNGPTSSVVECVVLDIVGMSTDDEALADDNTAGTYMSLKPGGFSTQTAASNVIDHGGKDDSSNSTSCKLSHSYSLNESSSTGPGETPYDLPAGSSIRVKIDNWRGGKGNNCKKKSYVFDEDFIASQDYPNFYLWWFGDNGDFTTGSSNGVSCNQYLDSGLGPFNTEDAKSSACFVTKIYCYTNGTSLNFRNRCGIPRCSSFWGDKRPGHVGTRIEIVKGGGMIVWETVPGETDPNLFYDASQMYDIYTDAGIRYHKSGEHPNDVDQNASLDLKATLNFADCFTFGNGVESFRIKDMAGTKTFQLGERVLAVSNQEFKEANRFAGLTYSGVYSGAANSNNLNEFNLGLANYKDCETSFGPIQLLHSRETDILVLQEDRISYVLASKNVITDSTGGGAIASVPEVLGTQIARIEEYGISFNPESFAAWGADMFWTDAKRGSVINMRGTSRNTDQIQIVSQYGMRSWFRDQFAAQLQTQKIGGFDPYMNEYVLSSNDTSIPVPTVGTPCGTTLTQTNATNNLSYIVNVGETVGDIDIPYVVVDGSITVTATWNGVPVTVGPTNTNGTLTVNKTANTPNEIEILVEPTASFGQSASYEITVDCPPQQTLTIIRIVLTSQSSDGQFIHFGYNWTDGSTISPTQSDLASMGLVTPTEYISQTGVRSVGMFPYEGADITMNTTKIGFDDFDFDSSSDKFLWLSSNTLYGPNTTDINTLLNNSSLANVPPIVNPSTGTYKGTFTTTAANFPLTNQYLYMVWDLREATGSLLCFSGFNSSDACCGCNPICSYAWFSPSRTTQAQACLVNTNSPGAFQGSWHGTGQIPLIGEVCYTDQNCNVSSVVSPGFYIVSQFQPASSPKKWIEIGSYGSVIASGTC